MIQWKWCGAYLEGSVTVKSGIGCIFGVDKTNTNTHQLVVNTTRNIIPTYFKSHNTQDAIFWILPSQINAGLTIHCMIFAEHSEFIDISTILDMPQLPEQVAHGSKIYAVHGPTLFHSFRHLRTRVPLYKLNPTTHLFGTADETGHTATLSGNNIHSKSLRIDSETWCDLVKQAMVERQREIDPDSALFREFVIKFPNKISTAEPITVPTSQLNTLLQPNSNLRSFDMCESNRSDDLAETPFTLVGKNGKIQRAKAGPSDAISENNHSNCETNFINVDYIPISLNRFQALLEAENHKAVSTKQLQSTVVTPAVTAVQQPLSVQNTHETHRNAQSRHKSSSNGITVNSSHVVSAVVAVHNTLFSDNTQHNKSHSYIAAVLYMILNNEVVGLTALSHSQCIIRIKQCNDTLLSSDLTSVQQQALLCMRTFYELAFNVKYTHNKNPVPLSIDKFIDALSLFSYVDNKAPILDLMVAVDNNHRENSCTYVIIRLLYVCTTGFTAIQQILTTDINTCDDLSYIFTMSGEYKATTTSLCNRKTVLNCCESAKYLSLTVHLDKSSNGEINNTDLQSLVNNAFDNYHLVECSDCNDREGASLKTLSTLSHTPQLFLININRHHTASQLNNTNIICPDELLTTEVTPQGTNRVKYVLSAVVYNNINGGGTCLTCVRNKEDGWTKFSDNNVVITDQDTSTYMCRGGGNISIVLYAKLDLTANLPPTSAAAATIATAYSSTQDKVDSGENALLGAVSSVTMAKTACIHTTTTTVDDAAGALTAVPASVLLQGCSTSTPPRRTAKPEAFRRSNVVTRSKTVAVSAVATSAVVTSAASDAAFGSTTTATITAPVHTRRKQLITTQPFHSNASCSEDVSRIANVTTTTAEVDCGPLISTPPFKQAAPTSVLVSADDCINMNTGIYNTTGKQCYINSYLQLIIKVAAVRLKLFINPANINYQILQCTQMLNVTVQNESPSLKLAAQCLLDFYHLVMEFYNQPSKVKNVSNNNTYLNSSVICTTHNFTSSLFKFGSHKSNGINTSSSNMEHDISELFYLMENLFTTPLSTTNSEPCFDIANRFIDLFTIQRQHLKQRMSCRDSNESHLQTEQSKALLHSCYTIEISLSVQLPSTNLMSCIEDSLFQIDGPCLHCAQLRDCDCCLRTEHKLAVLPPVLFVQIYRCVDINNKNTTPVICPEILQIPFEWKCSGNNDDDTYVVGGVVFHTGRNIDSGHYWTAVRSECGTEWVVYNDSSVTTCDTIDLSSEDIVSLVYVKRITVVNDEVGISYLSPLPRPVNNKIDSQNYNSDSIATNNSTITSSTLIDLSFDHGQLVENCWLVERANAICDMPSEVEGPQLNDLNVGLAFSLISGHYDDVKSEFDGCSIVEICGSNIPQIDSKKQLHCDYIELQSIFTVFNHICGKLLDGIIPDTVHYIIITTNVERFVFDSHNFAQEAVVRIAEAVASLGLIILLKHTDTIHPTLFNLAIKHSLQPKQLMSNQQLRGIELPHSADKINFAGINLCVEYNFEEYDYNFTEYQSVSLLEYPINITETDNITHNDNNTIRFPNISTPSSEIECRANKSDFNTPNQNSLYSKIFHRQGQGMISPGVTPDRRRQHLVDHPQQSTTTSLLSEYSLQSAYSTMPAHTIQPVSLTQLFNELPIVNEVKLTSSCETVVHSIEPSHESQQLLTSIATTSVVNNTTTNISSTSINKYLIGSKRVVNISVFTSIKSKTVDRCDNMYLQATVVSYTTKEVVFQCGQSDIYFKLNSSKLSRFTKTKCVPHHDKIYIDETIIMSLYTHCCTDKTMIKAYATLLSLLHSSDNNVVITADEAAELIHSNSDNNLSTVSKNIPSPQSEANIIDNNINNSRNISPITPPVSHHVANTQYNLITVNTAFSELKTGRSSTFGWSCTFSYDSSSPQYNTDDTQLYGPMPSVGNQESYSLATAGAAGGATAGNNHHTINCRATAELHALGEALLYIAHQRTVFQNVIILIHCHTQSCIDLILGVKVSTLHVPMFNKVQALFNAAKTIAHITLKQSYGAHRNSVLDYLAEQGAHGKVCGIGRYASLATSSQSFLGLTRHNEQQSASNTQQFDGNNSQTNDIGDTAEDSTTVFDRFPLESKWFVSVSAFTTKQKTVKPLKGSAAIINNTKLFSPATLGGLDNNIKSEIEPHNYSTIWLECSVIQRNVTRGISKYVIFRCGESDIIFKLGSRQLDHFIRLNIPKNTSQDTHVCFTETVLSNFKNNIHDDENNITTEYTSIYHSLIALFKTSPIMVTPQHWYTVLNKVHSVIPVVMFQPHIQPTTTTTTNNINTTNTHSNNRNNKLVRTHKIVHDYRSSCNDKAIVRGPALSLQTMTTNSNYIDEQLVNNFKLSRPSALNNTVDQQLAWNSVKDFDLDYIGKYNIVTDEDNSKLPLTFHVAFGTLYSQLLSVFNNVASNVVVTEEVEEPEINTIYKLYIMWSFLMRAKKHPKSIPERVAMFINYKWPELISDMLDCMMGEFAPPTFKIYKGKKNFKDLGKLSLRMNRKIEHGELGKAFNIFLSDSEPAQASQQLLDKLQSKHPQRLKDNAIEVENKIPVANIKQISAAELRRTLFALPTGVSPGPDGMRTEHLQSMCRAVSTLTKLLTTHCNIIASGSLPQSFYDKFAESRLIALCKPLGVESTSTKQQSKAPDTAAAHHDMSPFAGLGYQSPRNTINNNCHSTSTINYNAHCNDTTTHSNNNYNNTSDAAAHTPLSDPSILDIRPIAMGNTMRKLTSKSVQFIHKDELVEVFMPFQFGAGAPLGAECIIQIIRNLLELHPDWTIAKVDFKNAFNTIFRKLLLDAVTRHIPNMLNWVQANHINATKLWHRCLHPDSKEQDYIFSEEGVQQGEVLGPVNFCLAVQDILIDVNEVMQTELDGGMLVGYMDDTFIIAPQTSINGIWPHLIASAKQVGLTVNETKCQLYNKNMNDILQEITLPSEVIRKVDGVVIIGTPVGTEQYEHNHWTEQLKVWDSEIDKTCQYEDTQVALTFLTKCVATKMSYFTRMTNPNTMAGKLSKQMDKSLCRGLNILLNVKHIKQTDQCWLQACLSAKHGGLGIQSPAVQHAGAYLSSLIGTYKILSTQINSLTARKKYTQHCLIITSILERMRKDIDVSYKVIHDFSLQTNTQDKLPSIQELIEGPEMKLQRKFNLIVSQNMFETLWEMSSIEDKIRLDSCSMEGGALITTIPNCDELRIDGELYRGLLCTRLGLPVQYITPGPCDCCKGDIDTQGCHLQSSCSKSYHVKNNTHNAIEHVLYRMNITAGHRCHMESTEIYARLGLKTTGRVDLVTECYEGSLPLCGDVTVTDVRCSLATAPLKTKIRQDYMPETAADKRDQVKNKRYNDLINADCIFMALTFENFGRWNENVREVFKRLVNDIHKRNGIPKHIITQFWKSRISIAQHKTMAIGLKNRVMDQDVQGCNIREQEARRDYAKSVACRV